MSDNDIFDNIVRVDSSDGCVSTDVLEVTRAFRLYSRK
jgi:hypothetical protein